MIVFSYELRCHNRHRLFMQVHEWELSVYFLKISMMLTTLLEELTLKGSLHKSGWFSLGCNVALVLLIMKGWRQVLQVLVLRNAERWALISHRSRLCANVSLNYDMIIGRVDKDIEWDETLEEKGAKLSKCIQQGITHVSLPTIRSDGTHSTSTLFQEICCTDS